MTSTLPALKDWVDEVAKVTQPENIHWCDGSEAEYQQLIAKMCDNGTLIPLNEQDYPNCYLHRSDPSDVARVEHLTFICTENEEDAGPNNHWMDPAEAHKKVDALFEGAMKGRTMYVIPYCMGPIDSPFSRMGVEITDSPYVVANMKIMTRMGAKALARIEKEGTFVKGLHSTGDLDPERRFIMHFPEELSIKSIGSGYGGNALLGKKCHALRIASYQARTEGWLAEHMLIVGIENPQGETHYLACAFPSACGKTNLAMLIPPESHAGWKIWTLGDDIAWLHLDNEGVLRAINPEAGYFGVVPGTNTKTNHNAFEMICSDTIFTNVGTTAENQPWWEDKNVGSPATDWRGNDYDSGNGPAAHPNSRFTVSAKGTAGLRSQGLASWRPGRRQRGLGNDRGKHRRSRRRAPRPDGDEAVLRLQLRRLLGALAVVCRQVRQATENIPRQLVPPGQGRQIPVARIRRKPAGAALDHRPLRKPGRRQGDADRAVARSAGYRYQRPRCRRRHDADPALYRSAAVAGRNEISRGVPGRVWGSPAGRPAAGTSADRGCNESSRILKNHL
jgi:hypothetical protein